jgi:hypothetical protein
MREFVRNLPNTVLRSAKVLGHLMHVTTGGPPEVNKGLPKHVKANFINASLPSCKEVLIGRIKNFGVTMKLNLTQLTRTGK